MIGVEDFDPDHIASMSGMRLEDTFIIATGIDDPSVQREAVEMYHPLYHNLTLAHSSLFPGVIDTLRTLRARGSRIGVMTVRKSADFQELLDHFGLTPLIDAWAADDMVSRRKPAPDIVNHLMERLGASPESTFVVGDTIYDIEVARNTSTQSIAVTYGAQNGRLLKMRRPYALIDSFPELLTVQLPS